MISISYSFDESDDVRYTDNIDEENSSGEELDLDASSRKGAGEFDLFDEARRIYSRARATQRVRSSHII